MNEKEFELLFGNVLGGMLNDEKYSGIIKNEAFKRSYLKLCEVARNVYKIITTGNEESRLDNEFAERRIENFKKELDRFNRSINNRLNDGEYTEIYTELKGQFEEIIRKFDEKIEEINNKIIEGEITNPEPEDLEITVDVNDGMFADYDMNNDPEFEEKQYMDLFPSGKPKATDVIQTKENACFLLAPLASLAESNPSFIENMIQDNHDGTVTVKFFAQKGNERVPYNVKVEKTKTVMDGKSAPWANLIEKAYGVSGLYQSQGQYPENPQQSAYKSFGSLIDGGAPQSFIDCIIPSGINKVNADIHNEISDSNTIDDAFEKLKSSLLAARKQNQAIFLHTDYHVISVTNVEEVDGKVMVSYYDQLMKSSIQNSVFTVDLKDIFDGRFKIDTNPVKNIQLCSLEASGKRADMQEIYVSEIPKAILAKNNVVNYDAFKTRIASEFVKKYGFDKVQGKNEKADLSNSTSILYYATKGKVMDDFFKDLYNGYSKNNMTLGQLLEELKNPESEIINKTKEAYTNGIMTDTQSNYLSEDVKKIVLDGFNPALKKVVEEPKVEENEEIDEQEPEIIENKELSDKTIIQDNVINETKEEAKQQKEEIKQSKKQEENQLDVEDDVFEVSAFEKLKKEVEAESKKEVIPPKENFQVEMPKEIGPEIKEIKPEVIKEVVKSEEQIKQVEPKKEVPVILANDSEKKAERTEVNEIKTSERISDVSDSNVMPEINTSFTKEQEIDGSYIEEQEVNLPEEKVVTNSEYKDPEGIDYFERDREMLDNAVKELENARTLTNSSEYNNIIKSIKALNKESRPGILQTISPEQAHAFKLKKIGDLIDKYLEHKSVDGVKPNVRNKLLAVQKLNENISIKLNAMNVKSFSMMDGTSIDMSHREYQYSNMYNAIQNEKIKNKVSAPKTEAQYDEIVNTIAEKGVHSSTEAVKHVDECMAQIVLRAALVGKSDEYINGLKQVQGLFNGKEIEAPEIKKDNAIRSAGMI